MVRLTSTTKCKIGRHPLTPQAPTDCNAIAFVTLHRRRRSWPPELLLELGEAAVLGAVQLAGHHSHAVVPHARRSLALQSAEDPPPRRRLRRRRARRRGWAPWSRAAREEGHHGPARTMVPPAHHAAVQPARRAACREELPRLAARSLPARRARSSAAGHGHGGCVGRGDGEAALDAPPSPSPAAAPPLLLLGAAVPFCCGRAGPHRRPWIGQQAQAQQ